MATPSIAGLQALRQWMCMVLRCTLRGLVVWLFYKGRSPQRVAALPECCERTVTRWVHRYEGVDGLVDRPRPGAPKQADDAVSGHLEQLLTLQAQGQSHRWSVRTLCQWVKEDMERSPSTVRRMLHTLHHRHPPRLVATGGEPEREQRFEQLKQGDVVLYEQESSFHLLAALRCLWIKAGQQLRLPTQSGLARGKASLSRRWATPKPADAMVTLGPYCVPMRVFVPVRRGLLPLLEPAPVEVLCQRSAGADRM